MLACGIIIVAAPLILLYAFVQRYIVDGALAGALKA
jgi:raffinose/stachyose/melibiose transport system permease protein